jgi:hypothetical protein
LQFLNSFRLSWDSSGNGLHLSGVDGHKFQNGAGKVGSRKRIVAAIAVVCVAYAVWPYVTLFRLGQAIRHGNAAALETLVDWDGVREGIKEDICDNLFDQEPTARVASGESRLPPFGFSFVRGIAGNAVDENVNPQALVSAARGAADGQSKQFPADSNPSIAWAFFDGPTSFLVLLRRPGAAPGEEPIRIEFKLRHATWKVTRAWLPREMLMQANAKT